MSIIGRAKADRRHGENVIARSQSSSLVIQFGGDAMGRYLSLTLLLLVLASPTIAATPSIGSLEITLESSRAQPTAGSGLEILGTIKNISQVPVLLCEHTTTITTPLEIDQGEEVGLNWARFTVDSPLDPKSDVDYRGVLILGPGQSTHAFWSVNRSFGQQTVNNEAPKTWFQQISHQVNTDLGYMFFPPGDYKFAAQIKFWTLKSADDKRVTKKFLEEAQYSKPAYQNTVAILTVHVGAPIVVVLLGAGLGGLAAFLVKKTQTSGATWDLHLDRSLIVSLVTLPIQALGAMLLACIITILLSRLSETQFPIKVTVSDVWGAMAIGFLGAYSGTTLIEKYLGGVAMEGRMTRIKTRTNKMAKAIFNIHRSVTVAELSRSPRLRIPSSTPFIDCEHT